MPATVTIIPSATWRAATAVAFDATNAPIPASTRAAPNATRASDTRPTSVSNGRPGILAAMAESRARSSAPVFDHSTTAPTPAMATGQTRASLNHGPTRRMSNSRPTTMQPTAMACSRPPPGSNRSVRGAAAVLPCVSAPGAASGISHQPTRYSTIPAPPAKAAMTKPTRTTIGSMPQLGGDAGGDARDDAVVALAHAEQGAAGAPGLSWFARHVGQVRTSTRPRTTREAPDGHRGHPRLPATLRGPDDGAMADTRTPDRPPLRRSRHDQKIGGVCAGLAEYFGLDPMLVRIRCRRPRLRDRRDRDLGLPGRVVAPARGVEAQRRRRGRPPAPPWPPRAVPVVPAVDGWKAPPRPSRPVDDHAASPCWASPG